MSSVTVTENNNKVSVDKTTNVVTVTSPGTVGPQGGSGTIESATATATEVAVSGVGASGDPTVSVTLGGTAAARTMAFAFGVPTGASGQLITTANNSTNETVYPVFVDGATGTQGAETDTGLTYNPSTGMITASGVTATFTGNITGNVTGNADTVTTNANLTGDVTSSGNATSIASDVIVNADVKSDAAIAMSKTALVAGTGLTLSTNTLNVDAAQTQITSVGTIGTGTWEGTTVAVAQGGTGVTSKTGTGNVVLSNSPTLVTPALGTPASGVMTNVTGTASNLTAGTATEATNITAVANNSTNETTYPTFVDGATGTQGIETDTGLTYNPSSGLLTAAGFSGPISGAVTGNATTATALATGRTIGMTGDVVWTSPSFDGSGNVTATATIQANSVTLGTDTTGNYTATVTAGTGLTSTGATSGEGIAHSLSVDAAQTQITSVGTIGTGTWQGTAVADGYIASASTWNAKEDAGVATAMAIALG